MFELVKGTQLLSEANDEDRELIKRCFLKVLRLIVLDLGLISRTMFLKYDDSLHILLRREIIIINSYSHSGLTTNGETSSFSSHLAAPHIHHRCSTADAVVYQ